MSPTDRIRCPWAEGDELYRSYHDREWGVPVHDDRRLFEFLVLESAQAGLSWRTILGKREGYRRAFADFEIETVAGFGEDDVERLLSDEGVIRHRGKIESAIRNARAALEIRAEEGSLDAWLWSFVDGAPVRNRWRTMEEVPASTERSESMARALGKRGFRFLGPTTCYAFMQAVGMVDDHLVTCFRHGEI